MTGYLSPCAGIMSATPKILAPCCGGRMMWFNKHVPLLIAMEAAQRELLARAEKVEAERDILAHKFAEVADVADVVMHHFADSHWNEGSFAKMVDAMEPLRLALLAAGYGLPQEDKK